MNKNGLGVFPSDLDVQAESFIKPIKPGKKVFSITKGYVIPVFRVGRSVVLEKQDIIDLSVWKGKFSKALEDGCFKEHTTLTLVLSKESGGHINSCLSSMRNIPFPKLEHLYLECGDSQIGFYCRWASNQ